MFSISDYAPGELDANLAAIGRPSQSDTVDPCPGCGHGRDYHANGYCTHPRSIRPCKCDGGWYPR